MLNSQPFYHSLIRKYVIILGSIFDDIYIEREKDAEKQILKIPITYAPKEKVLDRLNDPQIDREYAVLLPRISFELDSITYDSSRKLNALNKIPLPGTGNFQYIGRPYNLHFRVFVYIKNTEDGTKIVEQIFPYFDPDWVVSAELIDNLGFQDIPIILNNITKQEEYKGDYRNRKYFVWELDLTLKGYFFGPTKSKKVIKFAYTNIYDAYSNTIKDSIGVTEKDVEILVEPGMTSNNTPTTDINQTISPLLIEKDDDWDYITQIREYVNEQ